MNYRIPVQVQVLVYRRETGGEFLVLALRRNEKYGGYWQPVTGGLVGGEDIERAALREVQEETGLTQPIRLHSLNYIRTFSLDELYKEYYDRGVSVIKEYAFGFETNIEEIELSEEHIDYNWLSPREALERFRYEGNREALRVLLRELGQ